jgi:flagellar motor switch protein FliN/FliY
LGICVPVSVAIAEREMPIEGILGMTVGTIIEFDVPFDAELTLRIGPRVIAQGQAVKVGENFGIQISRVDTVTHRIDALGAQA